MDRRGRKISCGHRMVIHGTTAVLLGVAVLVSVKTADADSGVLLAQMSPMRQDSITKMSSPPDIPGTPIADAPASPSGSIAQASSQLPPVNGVAGASYDPAGRRDPFAPIIQEFQPGKIDESLPPLQRVALTEINLIAIVWGTYGYIAMVQTPEGHGYTVKRGTKIGQNNGVVSAVTERGIIVEERFTDVYGQKQERESVKLLHPKEGSE